MVFILSVAVILGQALSPGMVDGLRVVLTSAEFWKQVLTVVTGVSAVYFFMKGKLDTAKDRADLASLKATHTSMRTDQLESGQSYLLESVKVLKSTLDEVQQERDRDKTELSDLRTRLRQINSELEAARREITDLKTHLRELNRENATDKEEILLLRARVNALELEVSKLTLDNMRLADENRELKSHEAAANDATARDILGQIAELKKITNNEKNSEDCE